MAPTVSVVIPTRNRREMLLRAVQSVLGQQLRELEVIVVDDGSSDGTADALSELADPRLRVLRHDRPVGVSAARNAGAGTATGRWLAFLDDDDFWAPRKLDEQCAALAASTREWVYAGVVEVDEHDGFLGGEPPPSPETLVRNLTKRNLMPAGCSNVMVRGDWFRRIGGFDTTLRHLADWDLWLRLAAGSPPACVSQPLVAYRIHGGQASLDPQGMMVEGRILEARHGAELNSIRRWLAWSHLRRGERGAALRVYARAAATGDVRSFGRGLVAMLHPTPAAANRTHSAAGDAWHRAAQAWLPGTRP